MSPSDRNTAIARAARRLADDAVDHLPEAVRESFAISDPVQRKHRVQTLGTALLTAMLPVMNWIERKRSADTAELVKARLHRLLSEAVELSECDIPEFAGGIATAIPGQCPSEGMRRAAELKAFAMAFSNSLRGWADEIESNRGPAAPTDRADGAGQADPPASETSAAELDELTDRQRAILETMLGNEITSERRRQNQKAIVRLINRKHRPNSYTRDFASLVGPYLDSREGPQGGMWIKPQQKSAVEHIVQGR